jgi:hypothetical protein
MVVRKEFSSGRLALLVLSNRSHWRPLLDLYDERATLECDCERVSLTGRKAIAAYWAPKLESKLATAFTLDDMTLTGDGVQVDYQSYEGKPVRIYFRFDPSGKYSTQAAGHWDGALSRSSPAFAF